VAVADCNLGSGEGLGATLRLVRRESLDNISGASFFLNGLPPRYLCSDGDISDEKLDIPMVDCNLRSGALARERLDFVRRESLDNILCLSCLFNGLLLYSPLFRQEYFRRCRRVAEPKQSSGDPHSSQFIRTLIGSVLPSTSPILLTFSLDNISSTTSSEAETNNVQQIFSESCNRLCSILAFTRSAVYRAFCTAPPSVWRRSSDQGGHLGCRAHPF